MIRKNFREFLERNVIILDGATGTELQKRGMPKGVCPEQWVLENPEVIKAVQRDYIQAGSGAVFTCTFGCNRIKLSEFGLQDHVVEMNHKLALLSREAAGDSVLVGGDLAPTGRIMEPFGDLDFEEAVEIYKEQVLGLLKGEVDFFIIETMMDIQEARAAVIAVKETCDLPVCVSMTFNEDGRTMMGTEPAAAIVILQSLGVDAVGCNCSSGPEKMLDMIRSMQKYATVPLLAKPNAGMPKFVDGKTVFDMTPIEFGSFTKQFLESGVRLIGGCCGTSPEFIQQVYLRKTDECYHRKGIETAVAATSRKAVEVKLDENARVGYIRASENEAVRDAVLSGDADEVCDVALALQDDDIEGIYLNFQVPGADEKEFMTKAVKALASTVSVPLIFETENIETLEAALRVYGGRAIVHIQQNNGELKKIAEKYGAVILG